MTAEEVADVRSPTSTRSSTSARRCAMDALRRLHEARAEASWCRTRPSTARCAVNYRDYFTGGMGAEAVARPAGRHRPGSDGRRAARRSSPTASGQKRDQGHQAPQGRRRVPASPSNKPDGHDPRRHPGHPAGPAPHGAARRRPLRHVRPQRPVPPRHQPQQPPQAPASSSAPPTSSSATRSACCRRPWTPCSTTAAAAARSPAPNNRPLKSPVRHAQGQAGPLPSEPAGQARRLLRPFGYRRRPAAQAAPVRPAEGDGARAVQAVRHEAVWSSGVRAATSSPPSKLVERGDAEVWDVLEEVIKEHPVHAQPCAYAAPSGHPGLRAGAGGGQGHPACIRWSAPPSTPTSTATRWPCTCRCPPRRRPRPACSCCPPTTSCRRPTASPSTVPTQDMIIGLLLPDHRPRRRQGRGPRVLDLRRGHDRLRRARRARPAGQDLGAPAEARCKVGPRATACSRTHEGRRVRQRDHHPHGIMRFDNVLRPRTTCTSNWRSTT